MEKRVQANRSERGITLVVSLLVIVALLGMGLGGIWFASTHLGATRSLNQRQQAMNAAHAGIEHARKILFCASACSWTQFLDGRNANSHDDLPTTANPRGKGAILYDGARALVDYVYPDATTPMGSYTVWVRNDAFDINKAARAGTTMSADTNGTLVVRVIGRDVSGNGTVVLEAALSQRSTGGGGTLDDFVFGKNVDPYGSNSVTGAVRF